MENLVVGVILVVSFVWIGATINSLNHNYTLERQIEQAKLDNQVIELQNENLKLAQAYYQTDEYLSLSAHSLLGKAFAGEHLVILPKYNSEPEHRSISVNKLPAKSNIDQWLEFLFGRRN